MAQRLQSGYKPKIIENRHPNNYVHTMFIAALCIITKRWKQPKCPSADECINKLCYIHTVEYYSTMKRTEILMGSTDMCYNMDEPLKTC